MIVGTSEIRALTLLAIMGVSCMVEPMTVTFGQYERKYHGIRPELATHFMDSPITVVSMLSCASVCSQKNCTLMHFYVATNSCTLYDTYMSDDQPDVGGVYARSGAIDKKQTPCPPLPTTLNNGTVNATGTNYLDTTTYTCDTGYRISNGSSVRTCSGGVWSGSTPTCQPTLAILGNLTVDNGETYGSWGDPEYCPVGTYAYSYDLRIEPENGDNTGLAGIRLHCTSLGGERDGGNITSKLVWDWGVWEGVSECPNQTFITGFTLQVEPDNENDTDKTAANWVKVKCRDFAATTASVEHFIPPGYGNWGTYGSWSSECGANSAVCGILTRTQLFSESPSDDTAVNDVIMYCCA